VDLVILVSKDDGMWYPIMEPHWFEDDLGNIFRCDSLLTGCEDGHL
jgi:hypothetical protein